MPQGVFRVICLIAVCLSFTACGLADQDIDPDEAFRSTNIDERFPVSEGGSVLDLFDRSDPELTIGVNRYIWHASLQVLDFLPIQSVDPFSGVIVTGFGNPPGGSRAYRATVLIDDPALDARSLHVAIQSRSGPVDAATERAIEDAILTRARQLRQNDSRL